MIINKNETIGVSELIRATNSVVVKDALDTLASKSNDWTQEEREQFSDKVKGLVDSNATLEEANCDVEYHRGLVNGIWYGGLACMAGAVIGLIIRSVSRK